jgi:large subunit ribosomal protein L29
MPEKKHKQNVEDLRSLGEQELTDALSNERRKLYEARGKNVTRQLENTAAIRNIKKQIARILTLQNERLTAAKG